jgi:hypothetical protein
MEETDATGWYVTEDPFTAIAAVPGYQTPATSPPDKTTTGPVRSR